MDSAQQSAEEMQKAVRAWAEFLYEEYKRYKHKQLLLSNKDTTIKEQNEGNK